MGISAKFMPLRAWSTREGAGDVVAVLFEIRHGLSPGLDFGSPQVGPKRFLGHGLGPDNGRLALDGEGELRARTPAPPAPTHLPQVVRTAAQGVGE
jgi:hypothetical protein